MEQSSNDTREFYSCLHSVMKRYIVVVSSSPLHMSLAVHIWCNSTITLEASVSLRRLMSRLNQMKCGHIVHPTSIAYLWVSQMTGPVWFASAFRPRATQLCGLFVPSCVHHYHSVPCGVAIIIVCPPSDPCGRLQRWSEAARAFATHLRVRAAAICSHRFCATGD